MAKKRPPQSRYAAGLVRLGYQELTATRYVGCRAFRHPDRPTVLVFVGTAGSLRAGQNRSTCRVVSKAFIEKVIAAATVAEALA